MGDRAGDADEVGRQRVTALEIILAAISAGAGFAFARAIVDVIALRLRLRAVKHHNERAYAEARAFHDEHHGDDSAAVEALSRAQERSPYL